MPQLATHFIPYGSLNASCGLHERRARQRSDERKDVTCEYCQAEMTDLGDLPPIIKMACKNCDQDIIESEKHFDDWVGTGWIHVTGWYCCIINLGSYRRLSTATFAEPKEN